MSFNVKALCAFKKLGAMALITATLTMCFVACKQTGGGGKPTPTPKHAITFSVDSTTPNGMLKAKAEGIDETDTSPINVEEGKTVTFTAQADAGYKIGKWTVTPAEALQDGTGADGSETAKVKITADTTVKVSFELIPVEGGAVLILSPDKLNIKVKAKTADGSAITVEGCTETTLANDTETELHAKGTKVVLKGKITSLNCSYNMLTALNVQGLTALQSLECYNNQLTELNVQGCTSLQGLSCGNNQLTELNVQGLTALQSLACRDNQLTELNVQGLTALQELYCGVNNLTELNVQDLTKLRSFSCVGNNLIELNVQGCVALQFLNCSSNKLTALNVQGCTAFESLHCDNNQLTELNVQGLTKLRVYNCFNNQIKAQAMTKILKALPTRNADDITLAILYTEKTGEPEGNHKDFSNPPELKDALDGAKSRNWRLKKINASEKWEEI